VNREQVTGTWEQLKGKAKRIWGELTDDDFKKVEGSVEQLYGLIQQRFGDSKEEAKRKIDQMH
jgi:uncharacterized protein YjbJ (UPF0337 family)